jgi:hypothetical protein
MSNLVILCNAISSLVLALLITAQTSPDGELLVNGYKGLAVVVFVLLASGIWNILGLIAETTIKS